MELILLIGIPASGKSSFFKARLSDTHVRLNLDMLKTRHRLKLLFRASLEARAHVVVDNTNLTVKERAPYLEAARAAGYRIVGYFLQSRVHDALARNAARGRPVPDVAVKSASKALELPTLSEDFDELFFVSLNEGDFIVEPWQE